jgi:hypothetical protein
MDTLLDHMLQHHPMMLISIARDQLKDQSLGLTDEVFTPEEPHGA